MKIGTWCDLLAPITNPSQSGLGLCVAFTMIALEPHRTIDFKTIDGTKLEAWLWEVDGPAPIIIMSTGVSEQDTPPRFHETKFNIANDHVFDVATAELC